MSVLLDVSIGFFLCAAIISGAFASFVSSGAKAEIADADTAYASRLYRKEIDQFLFRQLPIRIAVLFREPPPSAIASTVQTMRWVYGINLGMFVGFIGCLLISLLAHTV